MADEAASRPSSIGGMILIILLWIAGACIIVWIAYRLWRRS
jgi:threonine/homoserine/homoserine lactone efflux protein